MDSMTATSPAADATTDDGVQSGLGVVSIAKSYDKRAVLTCLAPMAQVKPPAFIPSWGW
jgi:hypothetical protein